MDDQGPTLRVHRLRGPAERSSAGFFFLVRQLPERSVIPLVGSSNEAQNEIRSICDRAFSPAYYCRESRRDIVAARQG
jgi:hypothetical protein